MAGEVAYLGCERHGLLDIFNCLRVTSYVNNLGGRNWQRHGCCPEGVSDWISPGDLDPNTPTPNVAPPYTSPEEDNAWWYREGNPESAGFLGFEPTSINGLFQSTKTRDFTNTVSACQTLAFSPVKSRGIELVVEGILHGVSCCAVAYGLRALTQKLQGCCGKCKGSSLRILTCIPRKPGDAQCAIDYSLPEETTNPFRTIHNVQMTEYPSIVRRDGPSCGTCGCSKATYVRFVLRGDPNLFLDPITLLDTVPIPQGAECIIICDPEVCEDVDFYSDPRCEAPILPLPGRAPTLCYCPPVAANRSCFTASVPENMFDYRLRVDIYAGDKPLRNVRVRMWRQISTLDYSSGVYNSCNTCVDIGIAYVPTGSWWTLSPCNGVEISTYGDARPARQSLFSGSGQPRPPCVTLSCGNFVICVESDPLETDDQATIKIQLVPMEPL